MKKILIPFLLLFTNIFLAQEYKDYDWQKPELYTPTDVEKDLGEIQILNKNIKEFVVAQKESFDFTITHTKTYLNSDEAIERNNKIYIPFKSEGEEIITQKVRVIKSDGTVLELNSNDIKESEDQETKVKYKYFALNGLEKKCIVEQLIIGKYIPKLSGKSILLQDEYLNKNISYELIYPKHLIFNIKSYNGLPSFTENKEKYPEKISQKIEIDIISPLKDEKYSNYVLNTKKFSYKLSGNTYSQKYNLYNYKDYTTNLLEFLDKELDAKDKSALTKFLKQLPLNIPDGKEKILIIEDFIKKNIAYNENSDEASNIATTVTNKYSNSYGLIKLYKSIFNFYKIPAEVVITSDRYKNPMDPKLESYANLDEFVFYFPDLNGYLCPSEIDYRFPFIPYKWTNCFALFTKYTEFGDAKIPDFEIKKIKTPGIDFTHDEMNIMVDFTKNLNEPNVVSEIQFNGYSAFNFQPYYDFIPEDKQIDFEKEIAENYANKKDNITITCENKGTKFLGKPYIFKANYIGDNLVEKVGDKILLKLGLVIGKQAELYQEDKRQMPIDIQFPHSYIRKIKVLLPKDYSITNLEKINTNFNTLLKNNESCKFTTSFKMENGELIIENIEFYKDVELPIESYESYIKVLNAAADFNKLVLILQKNK